MLQLTFGCRNSKVIKKFRYIFSTFNVLQFKYHMYIQTHACYKFLW